MKVDMRTTARLLSMLGWGLCSHRLSCRSQGLPQAVQHA